LGFSYSILFLLFWWDWDFNSGLHNAKQVLHHLSHTSRRFALLILEIESCELFAQGGLELPSS
jgi:hypothetical protein